MVQGECKGTLQCHGKHLGNCQADHGEGAQAVAQQSAEQAVERQPHSAGAEEMLRQMNDVV